MKLPTKTVLIKLEHGVVMVSPSPGLKNYKNEIEAFGEVRDIVAPNLFHHLGVPGAKALFPYATLWGPPGLAEKRPALPWDKVLCSEDWPYESELGCFPIEGMPKVNEMALLHHASKTLVLTDLCFNHKNGAGLGHWLIFRAFGTYKRFAVSRLFSKMVRDKALASASIQRLLAADFENIILAHGDSVHEQAKSKLKQALAERGLIS